MKEFGKSLKIAFLFVGTIVGAGFASGKELLSFFGDLGIYLLPLAVLVGGLFFYTAWLFMRMGQSLGSKSFSDITKAVYGKGGIVMDIFILVSYFIIFSAMLAGIESLVKEGLGVDLGFPLFSLVTLVLGMGVVIFGMDGLLRANSVLVPIIIVFICGITLSSFFSNNGQMPIVRTRASSVDMLLLVCNSLLYVSMNMLLSAAVLASGAKGLKKGSTIAASGMGSILLAITIVLVLGAIFYAGGDIFSQDMPMLSIAGQFGSLLQIFATVIIWCGVFTTLISSVYPVVEFCDARLKRRWIYIPIIAVIGFLISLLGFGFIVDMFLPIMGAIGLFFILSCTVYYIKNKKKFGKRE